MVLVAAGYSFVHLTRLCFSTLLGVVLLVGVLSNSAMAGPCIGSSNTLTGTVDGGGAANAGGVFVQVCEPIGPIGDDGQQSNDLLAFEEQHSVTLTAPLEINGSTSIAAGQTISSYYVGFDPVSSTRIIGTVTFPETIVGIIRARGPLRDSDFLGDASTSYADVNQRGLESGDSATGVGGTVLSVDLTAISPGDFVRVITSSTPAPPPDNVCVDAEGTLTGALTTSAAASAGGTFIERCDPIGNVGNNNFQSNNLYAFAESSQVPLHADLSLDEGPQIALPSGTLVTSYYVVFDPDQTRDLVGYVEFPEPILGVATSRSGLADSDFLGNPTANYLNPTLRGLEAGVDSVSAVGNRLTVSFVAGTPGDSIRVLTGSFQAEPVGDAGAADAGAAEAGAAEAGGIDAGGIDAGSDASADLDDGTDDGTDLDDSADLVDGTDLDDSTDGGLATDASDDGGASTGDSTAPGQDAGAQADAGVDQVDESTDSGPPVTSGSDSRADEEPAEPVSSGDGATCSCRVVGAADPPSGMFWLFVSLGVAAAARRRWRHVPVQI